MFIEEYDDLSEQDVANKELAEQTTEDEDHLEADLNQELTIEYPFKEISDQQEEISSKNFKEIQSWIKHPRYKRLLKNQTKAHECADPLGQK